MKLDYLQYQELEIFTRFGARLEASMEAVIRKGRVLREILKQDRLVPLPATFHMAWLVAFNDGLFDNQETDAIPELLAPIEQGLKSSALDLDSPREEWSTAVSEWIGRTDATESA